MKKSNPTYQTIQLYWGHARKYPGLLFGGLIVSPISTLVSSFLPPLLVANVLNKLSTGDYIKGQAWDSFGTEILLYFGLLIIGTLLWRLLDMLIWHLEGKVVRDLAERVYRHLLEQSANFHANSFGGSLVSQSNKLIGGYIRIADTTFYNSLSLIWGLIFTSVILARRAPIFVIGFIVVSAVFIAVALLVTRRTREASAIHSAAESRQTGYLADTVGNVMAVKSFAGTDYENRQYHRHAEKTRSGLMQVMRAMQIQMVYFSTLTRVMLVVALSAAVVSIVQYDANIGTVFLVLSYASLIADRLFDFSNSALRTYNRALGDAREMTQILQIQPEIKDPVHPVKANMNQGALDFKDVTFTHDGTPEPIFNRLSVAIKPGERIGLVGHSGSGKTTFTRLLLRFSDIDSGSIEIDGQNIAQVTQDDLHRAIAYVPQEPIMFHRSLADNIRYGDFKASQEEVVKAAKVAHAHEFIKDLPDGYETLVGERGIKLSGGQRQRIAIARAMLKNAPVLVLDEATSALDSESEVLIQDALWKLMEGRTAIVIAHRLSTVQKMDRIIVLEKGKIAEQGTHQELIANKGIYSELWNHQTGGFLED